VNEILLHFHFHSLSELPECQVPLAMKTDVIDQILAIALHPAYGCTMAYVSASIFLNLTQSPEAHTYIVRREVIEKLFEMCELKHKMVSEQTSRSRQGEKDDPIAVIALKYVLFFLPLLQIESYSVGNHYAY
jgi:hypothetical protein